MNLCGYLSEVAAFIERACKGEPLIIYGPGNQSRDLLYVKDGVRAICLIIKNKDAYLNKTVHLAGGKLTAIEEIALLVKEVTKSESEIIYLPCKKGIVSGFVLETPELSAAGWLPQVTLKEGLTRTFSWYRELLSRP